MMVFAVYLALAASAGADDKSSSWSCTFTDAQAAASAFQIIVPKDGSDMLTQGLDPKLALPKKWGRPVVERQASPASKNDLRSQFFTVDSAGTEYRGKRAKIWSMITRSYRRNGTEFEFVSGKVGGRLSYGEQDFAFTCNETKV